MGDGKNWEYPYYWYIRDKYIDPMIHAHEGGILHMMKIWETIKGPHLPGPPPGPRSITLIPPTSYHVGDQGLVGIAYPVTKLDVSEFNSFTLVLRVHNANPWTLNDHVMISACPQFFTSQDPNTPFISSTNAASVTLSGTSVPAVGTVEFNSDASGKEIGSMLAFRLSASAYSSFDAVISASLTLRKT